MLRYLAVLLLSLSILPSSLLAEDPKAKGSLEFHVRSGWQTYLNHPALEHPGTAGLFGFMVGYRWAPNRMFGASYSQSSYELRTGQVVREKKTTKSLLWFYRHYFRHQHTLQPFLDIGTGIVDPIPFYDSGRRGAGTMSMGALWKVHDRFGVNITNRFIVWSQDDGFDFPNTYSGETALVGSHEADLTLLFFP